MSQSDDFGVVLVVVSQERRLRGIGLTRQVQHERARG
jgi:hypothetical protein